MSEKVKFEHDLGSVVEDKVTGFKGTITGSYVFLNGCHRYSVEGRTASEHGKPEELVLDEDRLQSVKAEKVSADGPGKAAGRGGGPRANPSRSATPSR